MTSTRLPHDFADLEPFLGWALPTADERYVRRRVSTKAELKEFYNAMLPRVEAILALADEHPLGSLPQELHDLYNLALSLAEVAPHIELYNGAPGVPYAFDETRFIGAHGVEVTALGKRPSMAVAR